VEAQWRISVRCRVYVSEVHRVGRAAERRWAWSLRGARAEGYMETNPGVRKSDSVAMAHDQLLDWMVTRPPPGQSAVDFSVFVTNYFSSSYAFCRRGARVGRTAQQVCFGRGQC